MGNSQNVINYAEKIKDFVNTLNAKTPDRKITRLRLYIFDNRPILSFNFKLGNKNFDTIFGISDNHILNIERKKAFVNFIVEYDKYNSNSETSVYIYELIKLWQNMKIPKDIIKILISKIKDNITKEREEYLQDIIEKIEAGKNNVKFYRKIYEEIGLQIFFKRDITLCSKSPYFSESSHTKFLSDDI